MSDEQIVNMCYTSLILSIISFISMLMLSIVLLTSTHECDSKPVEVEQEETIVCDTTVVDETTIESPEQITQEIIVTEETTSATSPEFPVDDLELLALVTVAEAEGENEYGKRLVIDTILNRVDSDHFPNTIKDVIYQKNQFTSMWNGRTSRCVVTDDVRQLVREELSSRTNYEVIFFTADNYGKYGKPMFQVGNHYFSSY